MDLWVTKVIATLAMLVVMLLCVLVPLKLVTRMRSVGDRGASILMTLACFTGGVFLGTVLVFLLPEVNILINSWLISKGYEHVYPVPELVVGVGFFLITFLERVIIACNCIMSSKSKTKSSDDKCSDENVTNNKSTSNTVDDDKSLINKEIQNAGHRGNAVGSHGDHLVVRIEPTGNHGNANGSHGDRRVFENDGYRGNHGNAPSSPLYAGLYMTTVMRREVYLTDRQRSLSEPMLDKGVRIEGPVWTQKYRKDSVLEEGKFSREIMEDNEDGKEEAEAYAVTKAVILFSALITDEFLGGISMGLQRSAAAVWSVWIGLMAHETIVGIGFALQLSALPRSKQKLALALAIIYAIFSPLGGAAGTLIYMVTSGGSNTDALNGILQGLATGVFLYVTFFEILEGKVNNESRWRDLVAIFAGFMLMAIIPLLSPPILPDSYHSAFEGISNCSSNVL